MAKKSTKKKKGADKPSKTAKKVEEAPEQIDHAAQIDGIQNYLRESNLGDDFANLIADLIRDRFAVIATFEQLETVAEDDGATAEEVVEDAAEDAEVDGDAVEVAEADDAEAETAEETDGDTEADAPEAEGDEEPQAEEGEEVEGAEADGEGDGEGEEAEAEEAAEEPEPEPVKPAKKGKATKKKAAPVEEPEEDDAETSVAPDWSTLGVTHALEKAAMAEFNGDAKAATKFVKDLGFALPKAMTGKKSSDAEKLAFAASVTAAFNKLTGDKMTVKAAQALAKKVLGEEVKSRAKKDDKVKAAIAAALIGSVVAEL